MSKLVLVNVAPTLAEIQVKIHILVFVESGFTIA